MGQRGTWGRAEAKAFEAWLAGLAIEHQALDDEATAELRSRWRRTYAARLFDASGNVEPAPGFEYDTFARGHWPALHGAAAMRAYAAQREIRYYVLPDPALAGMPAYRCSSVLLPTFEGDDLLVCALDLAWTMVFTHEDGTMRGGPFFARADAMGG